MAARIVGRDLPASRILCLYHYPCHDGVFAALALHHYYSKRNVPVKWVPHTTFKPLQPTSLGIKVRGRRALGTGSCCTSKRDIPLMHSLIHSCSPTT